MKCPICYNKYPILLDTIFLDIDDNILDPQINIYKCYYCNFYFQRNRNTQIDYNKYYTKNSIYHTKKSIKKRAPFIIQSFCDKNIDILDIGAGNCEFLDELKNYGFNNLYFDEPSELIVNSYKKYDITSFSKQFDLIIVSHVLEHICDIHAFLDLIYKNIKDNGFIYIEVPNANQYYNYMTIPYRETNIEHINHFTMYNLIKLFNKKVIYKNECDIEYNKNYNVNSLLLKNESFDNHIEIPNDNFILYIQKSKEMIYNFNNNINQYNKICIYGIGQIFFLLHANSLLQEKNIILVDDNKTQHKNNIIYHSSNIDCVVADIIIIFGNNFIENKMYNNIKNNTYIPIFLLSQII